MARDQNPGDSVIALETLNRNSCEKSPAYLEARKEYDEIVKAMKDYISKYAPVTKFELSKHTYYAGKSVGPHQDPNMRYLSGRSLLNTSGTSEFISVFRLTEMLRYILITEGWESYNNCSDFTLYIRNNKNYYYL